MSSPGSPRVDPDEVRATIEMRQRIQELTHRIGELEADRATLSEVREQLKTDERALTARLQTVRDERDTLQVQLEREAARMPAVEGELGDLELSNAELESEASALEKEAAQVQRAVAQLASSVTARREQKTNVAVSLSGALGSLAHLEYRLRERNEAPGSDPPDDE